MLFWADFFLPKALLGAGASVSRSVSPRQWALSADNGQREECRRRAGLEEGQSAFRRQWPSGCCREGPAVTRAASSKAPFIGPAGPEEWPLGPCGAGGPRLPSWSPPQAAGRAPSPCFIGPLGRLWPWPPLCRLCLMKKQSPPN